MEPFIGMIVMFAGNFAPRSWALCDGQLLPINNYQALFSILGTTYGGDGRTTFALPDLRGRFPLHAGRGAGLSERRLGSKGGEERHTLTAQEMPSHTHVAATTIDLATNSPATSTEASGNILANAENTNIYANALPDTSLGNANVTVNNTGGGQPFNNMQPFQCVNYIIALQGTFPSRS